PRGARAPRFRPLRPDRGGRPCRVGRGTGHGRRAARRRRPPEARDHGRGREGPRLPQAVRGRSGHDRALDGARAEVAARGRRRGPMTAASPSRPAIPAERYATRIRRFRELVDAGGLTAALISVGRDLEYLTGYRAMPLERLPMPAV